MLSTKLTVQFCYAAGYASARLKKNTAFLTCAVSGLWNTGPPILSFCRLLSHTTNLWRTGTLPVNTSTVSLKSGSSFSEQQFHTQPSAASLHAIKIMPRSYEDAVNTLNTLQSNFSVLERIRVTNDENRHLSLPETIATLKCIGLTLDDLDRLSVIHVSGTKGKGSTCALTESILRAHSARTGFYSSPHLVEVRERIRINGRSLTRDAFTNYFWDCYDKLIENKHTKDVAMPPYFRFLTIMAFYVFIKEKVDVAVVEVGIGGEYDCTNIVRQPVVCGVSSLGIDHTSILGDTIEKIAWHKGGIFKSGVPAITVPQPRGALEVLRDRAAEKRCPLITAPALSSYSRQVAISLPGGAQQELNASLAVQLSHFWLQDRSLSTDERRLKYSGAAYISDQSSVTTPTIADVFPLTSHITTGLATCSWPGRYQKICGPGITYYLDGAHTNESILLCADWFNNEAAAEAKSLCGKIARVLIFNTTGDRNAHMLLAGLVKCRFDCAIFCPNIQSIDTNHPDTVNLMITLESQLRRCTENRRAWLDLLEHHSERQANSFCPSCAGDHSLKTDLDVMSESGDRLSDNNNALAAAADSIPSLTFRTILDSLVCASRGQDVRLRSAGMPKGVIFTSGAGDDRIPRCLKMADHVQVLCTGSLILVGNILGLLDPEVCERLPSQ